MRKRKANLLPDTRPRWDDPDLRCSYGKYKEGKSALDVQRGCKHRMHDLLPEWDPSPEWYADPSYFWGCRNKGDQSE